jgi:hypothetical protein
MCLSQLVSRLQCTGTWLFPFCHSNNHKAKAPHSWGLDSNQTSVLFWGFTFTLTVHWNQSNKDLISKYRPQITSWSRRYVNVLSALRGEYKACRWTEDSYWSAMRRRSDLQPNCKHRAVWKQCNSLVHFIIWGVNAFRLGINEDYFRSRNLALPQDSHSLMGSTRDLWTVLMPPAIHITNRLYESEPFFKSW